MSLSLNKLSLPELKELRSQVLNEISNFEVRIKNEVLSELEEKAVELGFSLPELISFVSAKTRMSAVQKYANPTDLSDTWCGRGRKPRWFTVAMATGKSPDDLLICNSQHNG